MRIDCPHCGARDSREFSYLGDASVSRPQTDNLDEESCYEYVYLRANVKGLMKEYWYHAQGCRSWLIVERDTATHEIKSVMSAQIPKEK